MRAQCPVAIMGRACWIAAFVCLSVLCRDVVPDDFSEYKKDKNHEATCAKVCSAVGVDPSLGCRYAPASKAMEEVVVVTNGDSDMKAWDWQSVTMVASSYFTSIPKNGLAACVAHSQGKRYGLRESVPIDYASRDDFIGMLTTYQKLLMVDNIVFDLLDAFKKIEGINDAPVKSNTLSNLTSLLVDASKATGSNREVFCIVPWLPPCDSDCGDVENVLRQCHVLVMSPDSYTPTPDNGSCVAGATVPMSKFFYGIERYISLHRQPMSLVAGVPWHGYNYTCKNDISSTDRCTVDPVSKTTCFDETNRKKMSLAEIYVQNIPNTAVKMDNLNQALFYKSSDFGQLWYENFTTLFVKYSMVKDLKLRCLSLWYGEDMTLGLSVGKSTFGLHNWDFLLHNILHKAVHDPPSSSHYYADTIAGVGVGCLLLGTALGVTFTCIAFKRSSYSGRNLHRPFKLDEDIDGYRDDEGL